MDNLGINAFDYFNWQYGEFDESNLLSRTRYFENGCCEQEVAQDERAYLHDLLLSMSERYTSEDKIADTCDFRALPSLLVAEGFPIEDFSVQENRFSISCHFLFDDICFRISRPLFPADARTMQVNVWEQELAFPLIAETDLASFFAAVLERRNEIRKTLSALHRSYLQKVGKKNDVRERICHLVAECLLGRCRFTLEEYKNVTRVMAYLDDLMTVKLEIPLEDPCLEKVEESLKRLKLLLDTTDNEK